VKNHLLTFAVFALAIANPAAPAQQSSGVPVHIVVTVEARKGKEFIMPNLLSLASFAPLREILRFGCGFAVFKH